MSNYRRAKTGHMFFFTVVTWKRQKIFANDFYRKMLGSVIREVKSKYPFQVEAFVLLPDHLHCIWNLPDNDFSMRWGLIKKEFTKRAGFNSKINVSRSGKKRLEGTVWQRRFWEHRIRNEEDYNNHCNYIHNNRVKHGLASFPVDWEYSTFHKFVTAGKYSENWCAGEKVFDGLETGE